MPAAKKLVNIFFSLVLIAGLLPVTAFASPDQGPEENANGKAVVVDQGDAGESASGSETVPSNSNEAGESNSPELDSAKLGNDSDSDGSQDVQGATSSQEDSDLENSWRYTNGVLTVQDDSNGVDMYSNDSSRAGKTAMRSGIDVSEHNGTIDWDKAKADGVDFAILRIGFIHDNGRGRSDYQWERNVSECERLGIPYGVYVYSYAETASHASTEADFVLQRLKGHNPSYPVYYDLEDNCQLSVAQNHGMGALAQTFCNKIAAAGYTPGVYANTNWWTNYLTDSCFGNWEKWVAQYNSSCTYKGNYSIWQYTSSGYVDGIDGRVDMNFDYEGSRKIGQFNIEDRFAELSTSNSADIQDGEYLIQSKLSDKSVIRVAGSGSQENSALALYGSVMWTDQKFALTKDRATGCYRIRSIVSGKYLCLLKSGSYYSPNIVLADKDAADNSQLWVVEKRSDGSLCFKAAINDGFCLDVANSSTEEGSSVALYKEKGLKNQAWSLVATSPKVEGGRTVADGVYSLSSKSDPSKVLEVEGGSSANGANVRSWSSYGAAYQRFRVQMGADGFYTLTNVQSGKALDAEGGNLVQGTNAQQWEPNGGDAQKWAIKPDGSGSYVLVCKANGLALDLSGGTAKDGTNANCWTQNGGKGQSFSFDAPAAGAVADGTYIVSCDLDPFKVFDIPNGSASDGAPVSIWESNMSAWQRFDFDYDDETGYYSIRNVNSGKYLDALGGSASNGTQVGQYPGNGRLNQRWIVEATGSSFVIRSAADPRFVMDLTGASSANGTKVELYSYSGNANQRFSLVATSPKVEGGRTVADGVYSLSSKSDPSKVLEVEGGSSANGANVRSWSSYGAAYQRFRVQMGADGFYTLTNVQSGKALDAEGGNLVQGTNAQQWEPNGGDAQKWAIKPDGSGSYVLVCKANGLALDLSGGTAKDGTNANCWTQNGGKGQSFSFDAPAAGAVADGTYIVSCDLDPFKVFDIPNGSASDGAPVSIWESNMSAWQRFDFDYDDETGYYSIRNVNSGKYLDALGGSASNGTQVGQYPGNGRLNQRWIVEATGSSFVIRSAADPRFVMDLTGASSANGTKVELYSYSGNANQRFSLVAAFASPVSESDNFGFDGWYEVSPSSDGSLRMDIANSSKNDGAQALLYSNTSRLNQLFRFEYVNGYYEIVSASSGKVLEFKNGSVVPGVPAQQASSSESLSQKWKAVENEDGTYSFICAANGLMLGSQSSNSGASLIGLNGPSDGCSSFRLGARSDLLNEGIYEIAFNKDSNKVLDVNGASSSDGANVQIYASNSTFNQKWRVKLVSGMKNTYTVESLCSGKFLASVGSNVVQSAYDQSSQNQMWMPVQIDAGSVVLKNIGTGKVLDVDGGNAADGTNVQIYDENGSSAQKFIFREAKTVKSATYIFHSDANYNQVMDLNGSSGQDGANVTSWALSGAGNQKWNVNDNGDGTYRISSAVTGKVLDVSGGVASDGANVAQYSWHGGLNQKWIIEYDKDGGFVFRSAQNRGMVLEVSSFSPANGTNICVAKRTGEANQRFSLEKTIYTPPVPSDRQEMKNRINGYSSGTGWLIAVDRSTHKVGVFSGYAGNWSMQYYWSCVTGAPSTPTITGSYRTTGFKRTSLSTDARAKWCTQIWGGYFFHTILNSDAELGNSLSHGCLRMSYPSAQWIYNNIYAGTAVVIYN